jgi:hypothetical protein
LGLGGRKTYGESLININQKENKKIREFGKRKDIELE